MIYRYLEHIDDLGRVDGEGCGGVDGDEEGPGVRVDQVVAIPAPPNNQYLLEIRAKERSADVIRFLSV